MPDLISVGFAVRNCSGLTGVGRYVLELSRRLPRFGYVPHIVTRRPPEGETGFSVETVPWVPLTSWSRAASFDWSSRRRLKALGMKLIHGQGDLTRQDVVTVNNCDAAAAHYVPDGRRPSPGVDYIRRRQFSSDGSRIVVANSNRVREDLIQFYGVPPEKIRTVYFGVDLDRFHPKRRTASREEILRAAGWPGETKIILSVLSGDPAKRNLPLLFKAAEILTRDTPAAVCLVGDVSWKNDAAAVRLAEAGKFLHVPATPNVENYFAAADVFALPAHYEEFGMTVLEAMASGCSPVVSARCGAAELVTKGYNGEIFQELNSPEELASALRATLSDEDRGLLCRAAAEKFTWEKHVEEISKVYGGLL
jgi:UDP-glucose:(heptosyl)LPS alpha-1,3-glucosyltransferase